ncbi:translation initiation factor IF-2, partial [Kogia breviceps]|uniref:translation initiation factor IF-2 n=1 Tax=Kogia breviceps TaxID=27615 RepID=UPI0034D2F0BE
RSRLPRARPPASLRPRAPQLCSPLGSGTGGAGPGSASSGWPRVLGAVAFRSPPAVPLSRAHPGGCGSDASQPRAQRRGRPGTPSPAGPPDPRRFPASLGASRRLPSPPPLNKVTGRTIASLGPAGWDLPEWGGSGVSEIYHPRPLTRHRPLTLPAPAEEGKAFRFVPGGGGALEGGEPAEGWRPGRPLQPRETPTPTLAPGPTRAPSRGRTCPRGHPSRARECIPALPRPRAAQPAPED